MARAQFRASPLALSVLAGILILAALIVLAVRAVMATAFADPTAI